MTAARTGNPNLPPCFPPPNLSSHRHTRVLAIFLFATFPAIADEIKLFNGKNLIGWTFYSTEGAAAAKASWSAKNGILTCTGKPIGFIRTAASYENYTLTYEWRWQPGSEGVNS